MGAGHRDAEQKARICGVDEEPQGETVVCYVCDDCVRGKPCILTLVGVDNLSKGGILPNVCPLSTKTRMSANWRSGDVRT